MAENSGEKSVWEWIKSVQINTEKWDQEVLFSWEYHSPLHIRIFMAVILVILLGVVVYIELKPGKQEGLIGVFYFLLIIFSVLADSSKNSLCLLTDKGVYRIPFWRKPGRNAQTIAYWKQTDHYNVKEKQIVLMQTK